MWLCVMFCDLKISKYLNQVENGKRVIWHGNRIFYSHRCVSSGTIRLPSFNGLCCNLVKVALFIYLILNWVECMRLD